jgi:serine/threonine protein kinase
MISSKLFEFGYTYIHQIGSGSFGNIHLIYSEKHDQYFVLKQNRDSDASQIHIEFEILKQLFHPNIINLYSMIKIKSFDCLVLEYCSGGTLEDLIKSSGPIQPQNSINIVFKFFQLLNTCIKIKLLIEISSL